MSKKGLIATISVSRGLPYLPRQTFRKRCLNEHLRHSRQQTEGWDGGGSAKYN